MNQAICNLITGKREKEAIQDLNTFKCQWRILMRDGEAPQNLTPDRNDQRYGLVIQDGVVVRVMPG